MIGYLIVVLLVILVSWLWRTERDPLVYLVPPALAFSPLVRYAGDTLGWPGSWLSVRRALVLVLGISLVFRFLKGDYAWRRVPGMEIIAPYVCLVLLSVLWSVAGPSHSDPGEILNEFIDWVVPVAVFFYLAASPSSESRISAAGRVMAVTVLAVAVYCGLQALILVGASNFVPGPLVELARQAHGESCWASYRLCGPFISTGPNALGVFLLLPAAYAANRLVDAIGSPRLGWALVLLLAAAVIAGTYSRSAQLGLIVIAMVIPLVRRSGQGLVLVSLVILLAAGLLAETTVGQHFQSVYGGGDTFDPDVGYRLSIWRVIVSQVADSPFGLGFNGWPRASQHLVIAGIGLLPGVSHSGGGQWMRELADRGIAGVVVLLLLMTGLIVLTVRAARRSPSHGILQSFFFATAAGYAGWAVAFVSDDHLMLDPLAGLFWYVAGIALAAIRDHTGTSPDVPRPSLAGAVDHTAHQSHIFPQ